MLKAALLKPYYLHVKLATPIRTHEHHGYTDLSTKPDDIPIACQSNLDSHAPR